MRTKLTLFVVVFLFVGAAKAHYSSLHSHLHFTLQKRGIIARATFAEGLESLAFDYDGTTYILGRGEGSDDEQLVNWTASQTNCAEIVIKSDPFPLVTIDVGQDEIVLRAEDPRIVLLETLDDMYVVYRGPGVDTVSISVCL